MTQNIEKRTEVAVKKYEGAATLVDEIASTDKEVVTPVGARKSFPKISREWDDESQRLQKEWGDESQRLQTEFQNDSAVIRNDWTSERNELSTKAQGIKLWEAGQTETSLNQQRRWTDGHTYLPKTVPSIMDVSGPDDNWIPYTADKSDVLSDVFGRKPVDLVIGVVLIPDISKQYPKLNALGKIWELDDNDQQLTVKSFVETSDEHLVITLNDDSTIIASKVKSASLALVEKRFVNADKIYSRNFKSVIDLISGVSADGLPVNFGEIVGQKVIWRGYYEESDGGSNWGIVKAGPHVADGGSIFSLGVNLYVEANLKGKTINVKKFGTKADDSYDDYPHLQAASNYQYLSKSEVKMPEGRYVVSEAVAIWTGDDPHSGYFPIWSGDGRVSTSVIKKTSTTSRVTNHESIDAVFIIANEFSKNGHIITNTSSKETFCANGQFKKMTLISHDQSNRVDMGIFSYGMNHWEVVDVGFEWFNYGIVSNYWTTYAKFRRLEVNRCLTGFDFARTNFGSNSTMNFEDVHCNGVDIACYRILGKATLKNCSIDGGGGSHIVIPGFDRGEAGYLSGHVTLNDCHHESPAVFSGKALFDITHGSSVTVNNGTMEIPYLNMESSDALFKAKNRSNITINSGSLKYRLNATKCRGALYDTDVSSRLTVNNINIDTEDFEVAKPYVPSPNYCKIVTNRFIHDESKISKYIAYVPSSVPVGERTVSSVRFDNPRTVFSCAQVNGRTMSNGFMFHKPVDITEYSRIRIKGTVQFAEGSGTSGANMEIHLNESLIPDGSVGSGVPLGISHKLIPYGHKPSNYSEENFTRYVDITSIMGDFYIGIGLYGINIGANIQEVALVR